MAGHGKSSIAKSIAEKARACNRLGASFFASRRPGTRLRDPRAILPTIAFQLAEFSQQYMVELVKATSEYSNIPELDMDEQTVILLRRPLFSATESMTTPLVVIDAFDELDSAGAHRLLQALLSNLSCGSLLPFKVFITSRPNTFIQNAFERFQTSAHLLTHRIEETIVKTDIQLYINTQLMQLPFELGLPLPPAWFQPEELTALVDASADLFVYAAMAVRFVANNPPADPKSQLETLLVRSADPSFFSDLDKLYLEVLSGIAIATPQFQKDFRLLIAAMILLLSRFSVMTLEAFLGFKPSKTYSTLITVRSLVIYPNEPSGSIQFYHPSLPDFFLDKNRCTNADLHIDAPTHEKYLASRCFLFIRGVTTVARSKGTVSAQLAYSCTYWASHLSRAPIGDEELVKFVDSFARIDFLRWLEIMSVEKLVQIAIAAVRSAKHWAVSAQSDTFVKNSQNLITGQLRMFIRAYFPSQ